MIIHLQDLTYNATDPDHKFFSVYRNDADPDNNLRVGIALVVFFFLVISILAFPNGTGIILGFSLHGFIIHAFFMTFCVYFVMQKKITLIQKGCMCMSYSYVKLL